MNNIDLRHLPVGSHRVPCPECAKRQNDKTLGVTIEQDRGVWHCFRCGWTGAQRYPAHPRAVKVSEPKRDKQLTLASHWRDLWGTLAPISGSAAAYLKARGCALPPEDGDLKCTESLRHPSGYTGAALIALVTDAITGEPITLHRTWVKSNGEKADLDAPRLLLGRHRKAGGVIRLWPDEAVTTGLAIAEGIETALTAAVAYKPVWSVIDAGNLAQFPVLNGIESLLIAADHDSAGTDAAEQCAERWYRSGREVRIAQSPIPGEDLNDFARRAA